MRIPKAAGSVLLGLAMATATWSNAGAAVGTGHSGWQWANPLPQGHALRALELEGALGYAAGDFGTVLRTGDGGTTWTALAAGVTADLDRVAIVDADSVVVAGRCTVRRSDDGGFTFARLPWTASDDRCAAPIAGIAFPTNLRGFLVLADGTVARTDDGGATWTGVAPIPVPGPTAAAFSSPQTGVVTTAAGLLYRTADGGASWAVVHAAPRGLRAVTFAGGGGGVGFAVGEGSTVVRTLDAGATWTERGSGDPLTLSSISCLTSSLCLAIADTGNRVLRTTDGGKTLSAIPGTTDALAAGFGTGSRAVAVGLGGSLTLSEDSGASWAPVGGRLPATFTRLRATTSLLAFAAGRDGRIGRTRDGGRTWETIAVPTSFDVTDVSFADAQVGYALDLAGKVLRTADGGTSWRRLRTGFRVRPQAVLARSRRSVLLIGPHGILRSSDAGRSFVRVRSRAARRAKIFEIDRAGRALVAFGSRRVAASRDGGRTWRSIRRPPRALVAAVDFVSARTGYLLEQNGRLWRTRDGGRRWRDLAGIGTDDAIGLSFASAAAGYLVLSRFGDDGAGYLLRTGDGGRTWHPQLVTNAPIAPAGLVARGTTGLSLALDGSLFFTGSGGDRGKRSAVRLSTNRRKLAGRRTIRVDGIVRGAGAGRRMLVARRLRGESGWDHRLTAIAPDGSFSTAWKVTRTATFVAQWPGDEDQAGDGSPPLRVVVRGSRP